MFTDTIESQAFLAHSRVWERVREKPRRWGDLDPEPGGFLYKDPYIQRATNKIGVKSYLQKKDSVLHPVHTWEGRTLGF